MRTKRAHTDDTILAAYAAEHRAAGYSPTTIADEGQIVRRMLRTTSCTLLTVTRDDLVSYLEAPVAPSTRLTWQSKFRGIFTFMQDEGIRTDNPAARLPRQRIPRTEPNPVTTAELQRLVMLPHLANKTLLKVVLYAYQGFRAAEIAAVSGEAVDWDERRILTVNGKGGVIVWRPIHPIVWQLVLELQMPRQGWWFPARLHDGHVRPHSVSVALSQAMRRAGIRGHRPHQLRAWFATEQLEAGVAGPIVQANMRHASPGTMKHYYRPSDAAMRHGLDALPNVRMPHRQPSRSRHP